MNQTKVVLILEPNKNMALLLEPNKKMVLLLEPNIRWYFYLNQTKDGICTTLRMVMQSNQVKKLRKETEVEMLKASC